MGVIGNYYLNGPTLASATNMYSDAALTTPAPMGSTPKVGCTGRSSEWSARPLELVARVASPRAL